MKTKVCLDCGVRRMAKSFSPHGRRLGGLNVVCRKCQEIRTAVVKARAKARAAAYDKIRSKDKSRKLAMAKGKREWRLRFPERKRAHYLLGNAVRDGRIIKQPCRKCGSKKSEAHHPDYMKPLDVEWLCLKHHREGHGF